MDFIKKYKRLIMLVILITGCASIYFINRAWFQEEIFNKIEEKIKSKGEKTSGQPEEQGVGSGAEEAKPVKVKVLRAYIMEFEDHIELIGTVRGFTEVVLKFRAGNGIIEKIYFHEGQNVKKGDIIASLNKKEASLKYQYNDLEYQKNLKLFEAGAINRSALRKAELELESASVELEKTDIVAPCDGIIAKITIDEGNIADEIGMMLNTETVWIELSVIEQDIKRIKLGQRIELTFDAFPGKSFDSIVNRISPLVEGTSRTISIKTRLDNVDDLLVAGMFARAKLIIHENESAIVIPGSALKDKDEDGNFDSVFVVDEENIIRARPVEISYISPPPASKYAEIASGIEPGDLVIVYEPSPEDIKDGVPAKIIEPILENVDLMKASDKKDD